MNNYYGEVFDYFIKNSTLANTLKGIKLGYKKRAKLYFLMMWLLNMFFLCSKRKKYLFVGHKFEDLIIELHNSKKDVAIISSPTKSLSFLRKGIPWISYEFIFPLLTKLINKKNINESDLDSIIKVLVKIQPDYLIVGNDSLPLERIIILAAKKLKIKTITIQHGLWSSKSDLSEFDGKYADHILVYDQNQKSILTTKGLVQEKIKILGFYKNFKLCDCKSEKKKVCIIGRGLSRNYPELYEELKKHYTDIYDYLEQFYDVYFKPHPVAEMIEIKDDAKIYNNNMLNALNEFDVFISDGSTSLYEASLASKVSIQIYNDNIGEMFFVENFNRLGYCYTFDNIYDKEIHKIIEKNIIYSSDNIRYSQSSVSYRFLKLVNNIL